MRFCGGDAFTCKYHLHCDVNSINIAPSESRVKESILNKSLVTSLWAVGLAALLVISLTAFIRANRNTTLSEERVPLPVAATYFEEQDSYQRTASYLGIIRAGSDSLIGFEVAGVIVDLPATEGRRVETGDILARLGVDRRQAWLDAAEATLARVTAEQQQAERRATRVEALVKEGSASEQEYDDARFASQALSAAQRTALAERASTELELTKSTLRAPYPAVVAERLLQQGAVVAPGTPVMRLVTSSGREAHIGVPIEVARALTVGNDYRLELEDTEVVGVLRSVREDVDPATLTVGAVFDLPPEAVASVGESARLLIEEQVAAQGGWLPITALLEGPRGLWDVLALPGEGPRRLTQRESVEIIHTRGNQVFVKGTLIDGTAVVATGLQRISPGDVVEPLFSDAVPQS